MSSASDPYRRAKIAQWKAERGGFTNTAAAFAAIAETLAREAGLEPWTIPEGAGGPIPRPPGGPFLPHGRRPLAHVVAPAILRGSAMRLPPASTPSALLPEAQ